jgi:hypothetical protein
MSIGITGKKTLLVREDHIAMQCTGGSFRAFHLKLNLFSWFFACEDSAWRCGEHFQAKWAATRVRSTRMRQNQEIEIFSDSEKAPAADLSGLQAIAARQRACGKAQMVFCFFAAGFLGFCALVDHAEAMESHSVIELFTSQGCASCPPADRLLSELAARPEIIALSFPVDYWDYIGWKDTLASPRFTARQKAYAVTLANRHIDAAPVQVYTPQAIVNGVSAAIGSDRSTIEQTIETLKTGDSATRLSIHLTDTGNSLKIEISGGAGPPASILMLRVAHKSTVKIGRGENAGRVMTYTNVVRAIHKLGDWDGTPANFTVPELRGEGEGYVVLLQQGGVESPGAILAAAKTSGL